MAMALKERSILITGATSGIGAATALAFARSGAHVLVSGRNPERGDEVCKSIRSAGGQATFLAANLADDAAVINLARSALDAAGGRIDVLVNAAGGGAFKSSADVTIEDWDDVYALNARAPFFLTSAIAPVMATHGRGAIVSIASAGTTKGLPGLSLFNSAKAALKAMSMVWAAEFGPSGVNVNVIDIGGVKTPVNDGIRQFVEPICARTPAARMAEADEATGAILFLASDAARHVHGIIMPVDGGYTITSP